MTYENFTPTEAHVRKITLTNKDVSLRRIKFVPPKTDNFKILDVKYPSRKSNEIASGNSIILTVEFKGDRRRDY